MLAMANALVLVVGEEAIPASPTGMAPVSTVATLVLTGVAACIWGSCGIDRGGSGIDWGGSIIDRECCVIWLRVAGIDRENPVSWL